MRTKVVCICVGNSIRSQIAEAYFRSEMGNRVDVHSAGLYPSYIHPLAEKVMMEEGIALERHFSKGLAEVPQRPDHIIVLAASVFEEIKAYYKEYNVPIESLYLWDVADPSRILGAEEELIRNFRQVRDDIRQRTRVWASQHEANF